MIYHMTNKERERRKKSFAAALTISIIAAMTMQVFAAPGYMQWLSPFEQLVNSMISFMGIIGKGLLGWALFEVATALFSHDTSQMPQALRRIGAGTILIFIETIISAMTTTQTTTPPTPDADIVADVASRFMF